MSKPIGFLQVDVDGLWAVRRCYGRPEKDTFEKDPCWTEGVPLLDRLFREAGLPAAFFLVGRDLELDSKRREARKLLHRGYEIGNHSYTHDLGMSRRPVGYIHQEVRRADRMLRQIGAEPRGFRVPGYDVDTRILRVLAYHGYAYDASLLPTYLGPLLRLADAWIARRWDNTKHQFGRFSYGRAPRKPFFPRRVKMRKAAVAGLNADIVEIPVGTTPVLRLPLTASALFPMTKERVRSMFLKLAAKRRPVLLLLHAIDGVDCSRPIVFDTYRPRLAGFAMSGEAKEERLRMILAEFAAAFDVCRADEFVTRFREGTK